MAADEAETDMKAKPVKKPRKRNKNNEDSDDIPLAPKDEPTVKGKGNIRDLLKKAVDETVIDDGEEKKLKKDKKSKKKMLERIRSGEDLVKDQDEDAQVNTYNPEEKNVRRKKDKSEKGTQGVENPNFADDEQKPQPAKRGRKSRKEEPEDGADHDSPMTVDELATTSSDKTKKKKKKPRPSSPDPTTDPDQPEPEKESKKKKEKKSSKTKRDESVEKPESSAEQTEQVETKETSPKKKKKKKKKDEAEEVEDQEVAEEAGPSEEGVASPAPEPVIDEGRVLGVTIHRTDKLMGDVSVSHPLIKVSLIDIHHGLFVKKQNLERPVTSFYESKSQNIDRIFPIMTHPFDFRAKRSVIPEWNEMVLFNENYNHFIGESPNVIIFFELIDYVTMSRAVEKFERAREDGGWHRIAWAFLKVRGANGVLNTDKKARLQLYRCPERFKPQDGSPDVFTWWKYYPRDIYPSTLYVTVKGVLPPETQTAIRSLVATQPEQGTMTYRELRKSLRSKPDNTLVKKSSPALWGRLPGQHCKIPNTACLTLPAGKRGCYVIKFSNDGRLLACGCHDRQEYIIMLYEIPSGKLKVTLTGHYGLIYDLCWSDDDSLLLSASGDGSARVWDAELLEDVTHKLLPHPSFVYTAKFHPRVSRLVATGGYDGVIRVWDVSVQGHNAQLMQDIEYHQGHVNSLCFNAEGTFLYSADSGGALVVWNVHVTENPNKPAFLRDWSLYQEIREDELKGTPISEIKVFYQDRRLLVQSRDNTIRMMDLRVFSVMQRYMGSMNFREHIHSTVTPCGTFVMAGSEDSRVYVWNTETGQSVHTYDELNLSGAVTDVDYHPHEHMVAFCSYGDNHPVIVYHFDQRVAQQTTTATVSSSVSKKPPVTRRLDDPLSASFRNDQNFSSYDATRYSKVLQKLGSVMTATSSFRDSTRREGGVTEQGPHTRGQAWRQGQVSMNLDNSQGRAQFSFKSQGSDQPDKLPKCVVLYDYEAARSDELDMVAGDIVTVLYKDNDNWWMGQLDGRQGYFPSTYVEEQRPEDDLTALSDSSDDDEAKTKKKLSDILAAGSTLSLSNRRGSTGSNHSTSGRSAARQRRHSRQMMESTA